MVAKNGAKMDQNWTEIDAFLKAKRLATVEFRGLRNRMHFSRFFASFLVGFDG